MLPGFPFPTNYFTLVIFAPNQLQNADLKIFQLGIGQDLGWTADFEVPIIGSIPKLENEIYIRMKIQRDKDTPTNLVLVSVTLGKMVLVEKLGVGIQKTDDWHY